MNLDEIKDNQDMQTYLGTSGMKYNNKGQMYFSDAIYFTHWIVDEVQLSSETVFNTLDLEGFNAPMAMLSQGMDWNIFGFVQNFKDAQTGDLATPLHCNIHLELYYVVSGRFRIRVQDEMIQLEAGDLILLNANALHSDTFSKSNMELVIIGFNESFFDEDFHKAVNHDELSEFIRNSFDPSYKDAHYWTFTKPSNTKNLNTNVYLIQNELRERSVQYEMLTSVYVSRLFQALGKDFTIHKHQSEGHGLKAILFTEVQRYIDHHYANLTLEDLAAYLKYSKDYFNRLIKELTGLTYMQYLQSVRVEKAKELLEATELSINEVAERVGYQNNSHFYDIFKNLTHQTPNEYRNERHKVKK